MVRLHSRMEAEAAPSLSRQLAPLWNRRCKLASGHDPLTGYAVQPPTHSAPPPNASRPDCSLEVRSRPSRILSSDEAATTHVRSLVCEGATAVTEQAGGRLLTPCIATSDSPNTADPRTGAAVAPDGLVRLVRQVSVAAPKTSGGIAGGERFHRRRTRSVSTSAGAWRALLSLFVLGGLLSKVHGGTVCSNDQYQGLCDGTFTGRAVYVA